MSVRPRWPSSTLHCADDRIRCQTFSAQSKPACAVAWCSAQRCWYSRPHPRTDLFHLLRIAKWTLHESRALTERSDRWTLPDGSIQRFRGGLAYRPIALKLTPEMNRVRLRLAFETTRSATEGSAGNEYLATLLDVDHPVFERALQFAVAPGGKATLDVRAFIFVPTGIYSCWRWVSRR